MLSTSEPLKIIKYNPIMQGAVFIRPIKAKLFRDVELFRKMDPYCILTLGEHSLKGTICRKGGKRPFWDDIVAFRTTNEPVCVLELMDKDTLTADDTIGVCEIDLQEVEDEGRLAKWYELHYKKKLAGEILIEAVYTKEQLPKEFMLYSGKTEIIRESIKRHLVDRAVSKHIFDYKQKEPRRGKGNQVFLTSLKSI